MATGTLTKPRAPGLGRPRNGYRPGWSKGFMASRMGRPPMLGSPSPLEQRLAVSVLSALSVASIHASLNPSLFTLLSFASKPEARERAMKGLWIGLIASTIASGAIWIVFDDWLPAVISEATTVALFGAGVWAVNQPSADSIPAIEKQETVEKGV